MQTAKEQPVLVGRQGLAGSSPGEDRTQGRPNLLNSQQAGSDGEHGQFPLGCQVVEMVFDRPEHWRVVA